MDLSCCESKHMPPVRTRNAFGGYNIFIPKKKSAMKRDGHNKSLWQDKMPDYEPKKPAPGKTVYDVVIVGAGVTGKTTAYELQKRGLQCLVAEARTICFGTSGGTTSHLNTFFDKTYAEVESDFGKKES